MIPVWLGRTAVVLGIACTWEGFAQMGLVNPLFIGRPTAILEFLFNGLFVSQNLLSHLLGTILATLLAFAIGSTAGVAVGLLFAIYPVLEQWMRPILDGLNALPRIALAPLFLLWFGLGLASKVALGSSITFFVVLSSTLAGTRGVSTDHLTLSKTLGATPTQTFLRITLPGAVPVIFSGLRLGLNFALLGVVSGEIIASEQGLGQELALFAGTFETNGVFAVLLLLALIGAGLTWFMSAIEDRLLHWR